jgi:hypothetical protein
MQLKEARRKARLGLETHNLPSRHSDSLKGNCAPSSDLDSSLPARLNLRHGLATKIPACPHQTSEANH